MTALADIVKGGLPRLEGLSLDDNPSIGDEGVQALVAALGSRARLIGALSDPIRNHPIMYMGKVCKDMALKKGRDQLVRTPAS